MQSNTPADTPNRNHTHRTSNGHKQSDQSRSMSADEIADADGRVLDVACGTGRNFRYLTSASEVVGIDISADMLAHARDELDRLGFDGSVHRMDAQTLDFADDSFDTVISSFSTCTFPDPVAALHEMERVCTTLVMLAVLGLTARYLDRRPITEYGYDPSRNWWLDLVVGWTRWRHDARTAQHYSRFTHSRSDS